MRQPHATLCGSRRPYIHHLKHYTRTHTYSFSLNLGLLPFSKMKVAKDKAAPLQLLKKVEKEVSFSRSLSKKDRGRDLKPAKNKKSHQAQGRLKAFGWGAKAESLKMLEQEADKDGRFAFDDDSSISLSLGLAPEEPCEVESGEAIGGDEGMGEEPEENTLLNYASTLLSADMGILKKGASLQPHMPKPHTHPSHTCSCLLLHTYSSTPTNPYANDTHTYRYLCLSLL